ncbi:LysM domain-containing protein [Mycena sanguinolenta]|uniref:LysM domain-containing protein n=1 Tax=Mycena sanguinolenta TaxID=230812 RepID=A0A8H6Z9H1_9AGAR|nr:LysM domain-containing protein [Mycena sanguinolenta]
MTSLCLACSSSLPPKSEKTFTTECCSQPICAACVAANPRLARYNPCLACLGGVAVVRSKSGSTSNVDGAVRDEDNFAIGDDEDDEQEEVVPESEPAQETATSQGPPSEYYIKRSDTLQGIAMRFKVDGRTLCLLNNLPPSTLTTTPHLLHTRTSLLLPTYALGRLHTADAAPPTAAEARAREVSRAGKRLQMLTKETDWRVARAYVALADDPDDAAALALKRKELGVPQAEASLEAVAADRYLEDLEWEAEQLRAGRVARIEPYPIAIATGATEKQKQRSWW